MSILGWVSVIIVFIVFISGSSDSYTCNQYPDGSMYDIFAYIYLENDQNAGKDTIHGASGVGVVFCRRRF